HLARRSLECGRSPLRHSVRPLQKALSRRLRASFLKAVLKSQLDARLEKLCFAGQVETIERTVTVGHLQANVVGKIPVRHRSESPERPASHRPAIEVDV